MPKSSASASRAPSKLTLELDGKTMTAAWKDVDIYKSGMTKLPDGKSEINFSDKYVYERAAYLLDRHLGLNMVPVAVIRKWRGKEGAVVEWVENATPEHVRQDQELHPPDPVSFDYQMAIMKLFDALIYNVDRNLSNQLITMDGDEWKLHLIDHSRSFRQVKNLPKVFASKPVSLPRDLLTELEAMNDETLKELLKGVVTKPQIKTMLVRRDKILEKIASDRKSYGDRMVFQD